jgi:hypothetical protein
MRRSVDRFSRKKTSGSFMVEGPEKMLFPHNAAFSLSHWRAGISGLSFENSARTDSEKYSEKLRSAV